MDRLSPVQLNPAPGQWQRQGEFVVHFYVERMDEILLSARANPALLRLEFKDEFFLRELALNHHIWFKKRTFSAEPRTWSVKFITEVAYQSLAKGLKFVSLTQFDLRVERENHSLPIPQLNLVLSPREGFSLHRKSL